MSSTPKHKLVAFSGPAGAGKSTMAEAFPEAERLSFAEPIRRMLIALGVPEQNLRDPKLKNVPLPQFGGRSARYLMQTLGTNWGREMVSDDIWTSAASILIENALKTKMVVIDDARFDNEADAIHKLGGMLVEVMREGHKHSDVHASERGISNAKIDRVVLNTGSVEKLHRWVQAVV